MATLAEKIAAKKAAEAAAKEAVGVAVASVVAEVKESLAAIGAPIEEAIKAEAPSAEVIPLQTIATAIAEAPKQSVPTPQEDRSNNDLLSRIDELEKLSGEDLTNAMKELKAALMKNPAAVEVMLPEDIGCMVTALRRMTGQEIVAATEKKGKKEKPKALSAEDLAAAFDEL